MKALYCSECRQKVVLRTNIARAVRRHLRNKHGPEIAPGIYDRAEKPVFWKMDRTNRKLVERFRRAA